jgi:hypothetical protein
MFNDLRLASKCNKNKNSYSKFPTSFNFAPRPYPQYDSRTHRAFTGSENEYFSVIEYEVF